MVRTATNVIMNANSKQTLTANVPYVYSLQPRTSQYPDHVHPDVSAHSPTKYEGVIISVHDCWMDGDLECDFAVAEGENLNCGHRDLD